MDAEEKLDLYLKIESIAAKVVPFYIAYLMIMPDSLAWFVIYLVVVFVVYLICELFVNKVNELK